MVLYFSCVWNPRNELIGGKYDRQTHDGVIGCGAYWRRDHWAAATGPAHPAMAQRSQTIPANHESSRTAASFSTTRGRGLDWNRLLAGITPGGVKQAESSSS